ncbi:MAG: hypothetical protein M1451_07410 [Acidobacteria bacterium]|nr:hypothetical protein [Acidobacteriota bacterium]
MRSRIAVLLACLALAVAAWAGDPWKDKSYKEWDEKDVNKILSDSPWSRPVTVLAFWRTGGGAGVNVGGRGGGGQASEGGEAAAGGRGGAGGGGDTPEAHFTLRWGSCRTLRAALARRAVLRGTAESEAEKALSMPVTEHQIVLFGNDMIPFAKSDEMSLLQSTSIKLKSSKQKISPTRVEIKRSPDGKKIDGIVFYFSMKSEAGEPLIAPDEKGVEFECRTKDVSIRQSFDPQKMVSKAGPDFQ